MTPQTPDPQQRACMNCEHLLWMVGLGLGVRCGHPANVQDGKLFPIPCRNYSCEHFGPRPRQGPASPEG